MRLWAASDQCALWICFQLERTQRRRTQDNIIVRLRAYFFFSLAMCARGRPEIVAHACAQTYVTKSYAHMLPTIYAIICACVCVRLCGNVDCDPSRALSATISNGARARARLKCVRLDGPIYATIQFLIAYVVFGWAPHKVWARRHTVFPEYDEKNVLVCVCTISARTQHNGHITVHTTVRSAWLTFRQPGKWRVDRVFCCCPFARFDWAVFLTGNKCSVRARAKSHKFGLICVMDMIVHTHTHSPLMSPFQFGEGGWSNLLTRQLFYLTKVGEKTTKNAFIFELMQNIPTMILTVTCVHSLHNQIN